MVSKWFAAARHSSFYRRARRNYPVHIGEQVLVDGGLLNPLPIMPTLAAHEADFVVAVNVTAHSPSRLA